MKIDEADKQIIIKLTSRYIAKTLEMLSNATDLEKQHIKKNFRYLQDDIMSLENEEIKQKYLTR